MRYAKAPVAAMLTAGAAVLAVLGTACAGFMAGPALPGDSAGGPLSLVSLAPGVGWAGLSYEATLVVASNRPVQVKAIGVAVQAASGARDDFPGTGSGTVDGRYVFTSAPRQFAPGTYMVFGRYEIGTVWHELPAAALQVLAGPSSQVPNPPPVGIPGQWASTLNAGPGYRHGAVADTVAALMTWEGTSGDPAVPNNTYENACYSPTNVALLGSLVGLSLTRPTTSNCAPPPGYAPEPLYGAQINTPPSQGVAAGAAVEADIYLPPTASGTIADWPAFWLYGPNWPTTGEIDIVEGLEGLGCYHFNWGTEAQTQSRGDCTSIGPGWHIFGLDWQPATRSAAAARRGAQVAYRMTYYYDGKAVGTIVQGGVVKQPMALLLDISDKPGNPSSLLPATMRVAYVRVWSGR